MWYKQQVYFNSSRYILIRKLFRLVKHFSLSLCTFIDVFKSVELFVFIL